MKISTILDQIDLGTIALEPPNCGTWSSKGEIHVFA